MYVCPIYLPIVFYLSIYPIYLSSYPTPVSQLARSLYNQNNARNTYDRRPRGWARNQRLVLTENSGLDLCNKNYEGISSAEIQLKDHYTGWTGGSLVLSPTGRGRGRAAAAAAAGGFIVETKT